MPSYSGIWTLPAQMQALATGNWPINGPFNYIVALNDGTNSIEGYEVALDSDGNSYWVGYNTISGVTYTAIVKYSIDGYIQWQRRLGDGANALFCREIAVYGSNVYIAGYRNSPTNTYAFLASYDTSGNVQWQSDIGGTSPDEINSISFDSSGNVYIGGAIRTQAVGNQDVFTAKCNSSGVIQWQRRLGGAAVDTLYGITVDSSGNVYGAGRTSSTGAGSYDLLIHKYDNSGAIQWQRILGGTGSDQAQGVAVDSSGNVYVIGYSNGTGTGLYDGVVAKYNSSGTIQWQRYLNGTGNTFFSSIVVDSSDNIYISGNTNVAGVVQALWAKYDIDGNIQLQRILAGGANAQGRGIRLNNEGSLVVTGHQRTTSSPGMLGFSLPVDGSATGTYGPFTYAASTLTAGTPTLTAATSSLTEAATTLSSASASITSATPSYTSTRTAV